MHSNAAKFARIVVLAAFALRLSSAEVHLRKPTAVATVTAAPQQKEIASHAASPVTAPAKALRAKPHVEVAKLAVAPVASVKSASSTAQLKESLMPRLAAEVHEVEDQVQSKKKQLKVQEGLVKEKEQEAAKAQKHDAEQRAKSNKLRKEAEVAMEIAQEKAVEAKGAEKKMNATRSKAEKILGEEREMERVLKQTQKEELTLEKNISSLKLQEVKAKPAAKVLVALASNKNVTVHTAVASNTTPVMNQAMQDLVEENRRLKHEKAELTRQLSVRKVAQEKAKLKQKLKNRLALADRHMKLRKNAVHA